MVDKSKSTAICPVSVFMLSLACGKLRELSDNCEFRQGTEIQAVPKQDQKGLLAANERLNLIALSPKKCFENFFWFFFFVVLLTWELNIFVFKVFMRCLRIWLYYFCSSPTFDGSINKHQNLIQSPSFFGPPCEH